MSNEKLLRLIIDFEHDLVFEDVGVYTCIILLSTTSNNSEFIEYIKPQNKKIYESSKLLIKYNDLNEKYWIFNDESETELYKKVFNNSIPLGEIPCHISRGSSTGSDKIYIIKTVEGKYYDYDGNEIEIEPDLLIIPIYATDFSRYCFSKKGNELLLFPYKKDLNDCFKLIDEKDLKEFYPLTYEYLIRHQKELKTRKQFNTWYAYSAARNLDLHSKADILIPLLANKGLFTINNIKDNSTLMAGGGFSLSIKNETLDPFFLLGLMNSKLLFYFLYKESNKFRGDYITCTKQYIERLPIIKNWENDQIPKLVNQILEIKSKNNPFNTTDLETQIDQLVYELYGLTEEEIRIVEGK